MPHALLSTYVVYINIYSACKERLTEIRSADTNNVIIFVIKNLYMLMIGK